MVLDQLLPSFYRPSSCITPLYTVSLFVVPILANSSGNPSAFLAISSWNSSRFSSSSLLVYLSSICTLPLPRLCLIALVRWLAVHTRPRSVVPTSAAHTSTSASLLLPFSTTIKSRIELSQYALSSPFCFCFLALSFNVSISLGLRTFNISSPSSCFVTSPCCPMFSFGLLAFPILELRSPTTYCSTASPCLLYFCVSTATPPNFLRITSTVLFDSGDLCMLSSTR